MKVFFYIILIIFYSCSNTKIITHVKPNIESNPNVIITVTRYIPYCGGAVPTFDMQNIYKPVQGNFILINQNKETQSVVKSDSLGIIRLQLAEGNYTLREEYKNIPFNEFYNKYQKSDNYTISRDKECYKNWWKTNLLDFKVTQDSAISFYVQISSACYTGVNPCLQYNGPLKP